MTFAELKRLLALLVGRRRRGLELLLDPADVARLSQEVLEEPPLALSDGGAERGRLLVGHVEGDVLRLRDRGRGRACRRIRVDARRQPRVAAREAALLRPDGRGLRRGEVG